MIDLTPLDVRNKRGDFKKMLRGYDPQEVDVFLELVAERLEGLVREVLQLRERAETLQHQVDSQSGRENAVHEALVTAQELRSEIRGQAQREADLILQEAQAEGRRQRAEAEAEVRMMVRDAERRLEQGKESIEEMERRRLRFLRSYRQLLERELDVVEVEEERVPLEVRPIEMDLGGGRYTVPENEESLPGADDLPDGVGGATVGADEDVPTSTSDTSAPAAGDDQRPPLDAPVDQLAAQYDEQGTPTEDADLLSEAGETEKNDEDLRWG